MCKNINAFLLPIIVVAVFMCGYVAGSYHTIINANPWVDTASNTILIDYCGSVHVYEYCED